MQVLKPPNIKAGKTEQNVIAHKYQDKDKFFLNHSLSGLK